MSVDSLIDKIASRVSTAATAFSKEVAEDIRETISEPYPPASTVGTPPHRRTGNLRASTFGLPAERSGDVVTAIVDNDSEYGKFLEDDLNRPFFGPAFEKWGPLWPQRLKSAVSQP